MNEASLGGGSLLNKLRALEVLLEKNGEQDNDFAASIESKVPRIELTKNQVLEITSGTLPHGMTFKAGTTVSLHRTIERSPASRDQQQRDLLGEIQGSVREQFSDFDIRAELYHYANFNIIQIDWTGIQVGDWIFYPDIKQTDGYSSVPYGGEVTRAAFVKLLSGDVSGYFGNDTVLEKWRFCRSTRNSSEFGGYAHPTMTALTESGSMLIALPVVTTGVLDHPSKLFANFSL